MRYKCLLASALLMFHTVGVACDGHDHAHHGSHGPAVSIEDLKVFSDATKPIVVSEGQQDFIVKLPGNPTTGYSWFLLDDYDARAIEIKSSKYTADEHKQGVVGSGGHRTWHIHLKYAAFVAPTSMKLRFVYARPWELGGEIKEFTLRTMLTN